MNLDQWLKDNCVNLRSFCRKAGVSSGTIYRITKHNKSITLDKAMQICKATNYQVTLEDLVPKETIIK